MERAPAFATIQDAGRRGFLAAGVPRAGAMDPPVLATLNALLGNRADCAALEWALGSGEIIFDGRVTLAFGGAPAEVTLGGHAVEPWQAHHAAPGDSLVVGAPTTGRFLYIGFSGGLECPVVMGSRSTYVPGEFGGVDGRRLKKGDAIRIGRRTKRSRQQVSDPLPAELRPPFQRDTIRLVPRDAIELPETSTISPASDRTGYRLDSPSPAEGASVTSEPVCPGVIQLPPDGHPIVLMADAPTIGGYRIAGAVISADLGVLAQRLPGSDVSLERTTVEQAQRELQLMNERLARVKEWSLT